jgi:endo-alpha-1,4-polygalactosaminidase (GH114 family)
MAVFKKQGVYWIDYYVNGWRNRERIGADKRLAETHTRADRQGVTQLVRRCDAQVTQTASR